VGTALGLGAGVALPTLGPLAGLVGLLVGALLTGVVARLAVRQVRGYTGDVLGAVEQTVETAVLLTAASLLAAAGTPYS
jgi:adenosylcobinamide-GDP ribazoletransferase